MAWVLSAFLDCGTIRTVSTTEYDTPAATEKKDLAPLLYNDRPIKSLRLPDSPGGQNHQGEVSENFAIDGDTSGSCGTQLPDHFDPAEAEGPHSEESSSSKTEPTLFSPNYEQMRHHKGLIGIGTYGRVEHVRRSGGQFGRWCAKYMKVNTARGLAQAQHELQMLQWQRGLPGGLQLAEDTLLQFTDAKCCKWAVIVMSFEEGHNVEDMVDVLRQNRGDGLLEIFACDVAYPTMQALADLHEAGLAHCDWKPDNLVLQRQPNGNVLCKPIDFGFARICRGEPEYYYRGTETFLSPELLENRRQLLLKQKISTAVNPHSADVYANGVMLTILLRSALCQEIFGQFLFEPPPWYEGLLERQRVNAHLAGYRRALQYRYEKWSPLAFLSNFRLPADCQDFLMHQLVPQSERATAAELISHPFLKRMAARRRSMQKKAEKGVTEVACKKLDASGPAAAPIQEAMYCREGVSVQEMGRVALSA